MTRQVPKGNTVTVQLPTELLEEVDERVDVIGRTRTPGFTRTDFVREAVRHLVNVQKAEEQPQSAA